MEIILGLAVVAAVAYYFIFKKDKEVVQEAMAEAPYKVETPPALEPVVEAPVVETPVVEAAVAQQPELKVVTGKGTGKSATKAKAKAKAPAEKPAPKKAAAKPAAIKAKKTKPKSE